MCGRQNALRALKPPLRSTARPAYESASWGLGQVMGFHWKALGYDSVYDFVALMRRSEDDQLEAMARYIERFGLVEPLRRADWPEFARRYNGKNYKENNYDKRLQDAHHAFSSAEMAPNWRLPRGPALSRLSRSVRHLRA